MQQSCLKIIEGLDARSSVQHLIGIHLKTGKIPTISTFRFDFNTVDWDVKDQSIN